MNNRIIFTTSDKATEQIRLLEKSNHLIVMLEGSKIKSRRDFFGAIEESLNFPGKCEGLFTRFDDWITDLGWLEKGTGICIAINSFSEFLSDDIEFRDMLLEDFEEDILPFWENEVVNVIKGGSPRSFVVVLID